MKAHLIHRQKLELAYTDESKAREDFAGISGIYYEELLPIIEEVFDEYAPSGQNIRIEKLEIDLIQKGSRPKWDDLRIQLRRKLADQLIKIKVDHIRNRELFHEKEDIDSLKRDQNLALSNWELFIFVLDQGHLPWWSTRSQFPGFETLLVSFISKTPNRLKEYFLPHSLSSQQWIRLVNQVSLETAKNLAQITDKNHFGRIEQLLAPFQKAIKQLNQNSIEFESKVIGLYLMPLVKQDVLQVTVFAKLLKDISQHRNEPSQFQGFELLLNLLLMSNQKQGIKQVSPKQKQIITAQIKEIETDQKLAKTISDQKLKRLLEKSKMAVEIQIKTEKAGPLTKVKAKDLDESLLISNGGLVLLAAFLPSFFKALGYLQGKKFITEEIQYRAALLLQSFISEESQFEEIDLTLNKLLCGIALSEPVPGKFWRTEKEQIECSLLLDSMASHWKALKTSSGKSIANGFLQREASLRKVDKGYQLMIPRTSIDILLNSLPWTIGIIKLPWMEETLFTEW